jgi:hypothetical protein
MWETCLVGRCCLPSLNVYWIAHVFQTVDLALNEPIQRMSVTNYSIITGDYIKTQLKVQGK